MKTSISVSRFLLGLILLVVGSRGFLQFISMPPSSEVANQFIGTSFLSKYLLVVSVLQVISGALLLVNRYASLALTILGAVIANILLFQVLINPASFELNLNPWAQCVGRPQRSATAAISLKRRCRNSGNTGVTQEINQRTTNNQSRPEAVALTTTQVRAGSDATVLRRDPPNGAPEAVEPGAKRIHATWQNGVETPLACTTETPLEFRAFATRNGGRCVRRNENDV